MSDLVDQIRKRISLLREIGENEMVADFENAAARILELEAENKKLKEALKPLQALNQSHQDWMKDDQPVFAVNGAEITKGDLRRAAALGEKP